ncbi:putative RNA-directed DNA polymerase, eukaryota, reverse transcriptase zinc-binding domain protein [Tanacetum coccineum]
MLRMGYHHPSVARGNICVLGLNVQRVRQHPPRLVYQVCFWLILHYKGNQRQIWDPGITWLKISKEHLEDKVFLWGELHQGTYVLIWRFNEVRDESERYDESIINEIDLRIDRGEATEADKEEMIRLLQELNDIYHFEYMDLRQKARLKWDVEGDENSKFFHSMINQRRRCQAIQGVMVNGIWCFDPLQVKAAFLDFYKDKFQTQVHQITHNSHTYFKAINSTTSSELEKPITSEEIRRAVWDCGSDKSPGPDGFSFYFLKTSWDVLKADVELFVMNFFTSAKMSVEANSSFITLPPKANRLASVVNNIVSHEQSAFIAGRQILDGPLILSEVIDWYRQCNKKMMIFKVDFEKAYDSVNWKYLDYILEQFGFGLKWRGWVQECLQSVRTSILVNSSPTSEFYIKRGLRQ